MDRLACARRVIRLEAEAVAGIESMLGADFEQAIDMILACKGRVVATGMGKAGIIAHKVASTLASTGTPSFFLHPAEGVHGDLGMLTADDLVIAFSYKGMTEELLRIIPYIKHLGIPLIAVTSNPDSELAKYSDVTLLLSIEAEACPLNLAPTSSTTAMVALGDTIALVLLEAKGFKPEDFALRHPSGSLGKRLLTRVSDLMHTGDDNPVVKQDATVMEAIMIMTRTKLAATSVIDEAGKLAGFFSDGDLRRYLLKGDPDLKKSLRDLMTRNPKFTTPDTLAVEALQTLRDYKIIELPVLDADRRPVGMIHLHDITRAGIT